MSYLVLARKYRPQTFADLVGQEHVTKTLLNALQAGRVAHAYVFSGPRGCGKTTTARLLAKALNCAKGPTSTPCGQCPQCQTIATGASTDDVLEIDGASNRGIDQIRELRETVKYAPARSRYRIFIIDEAHQITDQGFNALLKTLEEPPPHAVFMMATTEAQKIPPTILSRCQRFQLKPIAPAQVRDQLEKIVRQEKLKVDDESLREVARAAHGSLRDALSLLDQLISYSPDGVTGRDVSFLLGLLPRETVRTFLTVLDEGTPEKVLQAIQKAVEDGFDLFQLAHDLLENWHQRLLWKSGVRSASLGDTAELEKETADDSVGDLERKLQLISRCLEQMRRSESPRVTFELCCLELAQKAVPVDELLSRLERLESSLRGGVPAAPSPSKKNFEPTVRTSPAPERSVAPAPLPKTAVEKPPVAIAAPSGGASVISPDQTRTAWVRMIEAIGRTKPSLEPFLLSARWQVKPPNVLEIQCTQTFQHQQITANIARIKELLSENLAVPLSVQCQLASPPPAVEKPVPAVPPVPEPEITGEDAADEVLVDQEEGAGSQPSGAIVQAEEPFDENAIPDIDADPGLKKVLEKFPGKLKKIPPVSSSS